MTEKLSKLYNTLMLIDTKGENTKIMAQCLQFVESMIIEERTTQDGNDSVKDE